MNNEAKNFRKKYATEVIKFKPNEEAPKIEDEQFKEFAKLVKGTPNEELIAFKNSKVQELVDFITAAIILENERINAPDAFPIEIYRRYKSDESLRNKMKEWDSCEDKQDMQVTDYLGFKIIPEAEYSVFLSGGDKKLQRMIEKRERIRGFVADTYKFLSDKPRITFEEYTKKCCEILRQLYKCFPKEATERRKFYQGKVKQVQQDFNSYCEIVEDQNVPMELQDITCLTGVNIKQLLRELRQNYSNEVSLYKLHGDLIKTFENSELLKFLRHISFN